jgi:spore maturation protein CgeB
MNGCLDLVFVGLAPTSWWGNGHATNVRALLRPLHARGHRVRFLQRDAPWYAQHRDEAAPDSAGPAI